MIASCTNPKNISYKNYGGATSACQDLQPLAGIFQAFLDTWSASALQGLVLDASWTRVDYEVGNAFWMTKKEQTLAQMNKRALLKRCGKRG